MSALYWILANFHGVFFFCCRYWPGSGSGFFWVSTCTVMVCVSVLPAPTYRRKKLTYYFLETSLRISRLRGVPAYIFVFDEYSGYLGMEQVIFTESTGIWCTRVLCTCSNGTELPTNSNQHLGNQALLQVPGLDWLDIRLHALIQAPSQVIQWTCVSPKKEVGLTTLPGAVA